jgi:hypothetical protein
MEPQPSQTAAQRYYQAHKDERRAYGREYYRKNKEKILTMIAKNREAKPPPPPPPPPTPAPHNVREPLEEHKRRGISSRSPAVVLFN